MYIVTKCIVGNETLVQIKSDNQCNSSKKVINEITCALCMRGIITHIIIIDQPL